MKTATRPLRIVPLLSAILLQLIMTQVVTFMISFFFPGVGDTLQVLPLAFVLTLGLTFAAGVFLAGWLGIKLSWLNLSPKYPARLAGVLVGAYLPLIIALLVVGALEPGSPWFFISIVACILGFYLAGWMDRS